MSKFKVVVIEHGYKTIRYEREIINAAGGEFTDASDRPLSDAICFAEDCEGIMLRRIDVTADMIARFRKCRILARYGVGTDNVDTDAATRSNIIVGHAPLYATDEVSTHAAALLTSCIRDIPATHIRMGTGAWDVERPVPVHRVAGRTLGIIGFGNIGQAVARKMSGWNLKIVATDPFVESEKADALNVRLVSLDELLTAADYISLHCPLITETRHLVNRSTIAKMKPSVIIVNTARGGVINTDALLEGLDSGRILSAGLDVFEGEPLPVNSPLRRHPRIVITDHTAWYSEESQVELQTILAHEVVRVCTGGLPVSLANPEVLHQLGRFNEWNPPDNIRWQLKRLEAMKGC